MDCGFPSTKMRYSVLCLLGVACAAPSQLYLSTSSAAQATSLNAQQSSAVLASLLDVAHYEAMPLSTAKGDSAWRAALEGDWRGQGKKVVLLIESDQISRKLSSPSAVRPGMLSDTPIEQRYSRINSRAKNPTPSLPSRLIPGPPSSPSSSTASRIKPASLSSRPTDCRASSLASRLSKDGRIGSGRNWARGLAGTTYGSSSSRCAE